MPAHYLRGMVALLLKLLISKQFWAIDSGKGALNTAQQIHYLNLEY